MRRIQGSDGGLGALTGAANGLPPTPSPVRLPHPKPSGLSTRKEDGAAAERIRTEGASRSRRGRRRGGGLDSNAGMGSGTGAAVLTEFWRGLTGGLASGLACRSQACSPAPAKNLAASAPQSSTPRRAVASSRSSLTVQTHPPAVPDVPSVCGFHEQNWTTSAGQCPTTRARQRYLPGRPEPASMRTDRRELHGRPPCGGTSLDASSARSRGAQAAGAGRAAGEAASPPGRLWGLRGGKRWGRRTRRLAGGGESPQPRAPLLPALLRGNRGAEGSFASEALLMATSWWGPSRLREQEGRGVQQRQDHRWVKAGGRALSKGGAAGWMTGSVPLTDVSLSLRGTHSRPRCAPACGGNPALPAPVRGHRTIGCESGSGQ